METELKIGLKVATFDGFYGYLISPKMDDRFWSIKLENGEIEIYNLRQFIVLE